MLKIIIERIYLVENVLFFCQYPSVNRPQLPLNHCHCSVIPVNSLILIYIKNNDIRKFYKDLFCLIQHTIGSPSKSQSGQETYEMKITLKFFYF